MEEVERLVLVAMEFIGNLTGNLPDEDYDEFIRKLVVSLVGDDSDDEGLEDDEDEP